MLSVSFAFFFVVVFGHNDAEKVFFLLCCCFNLCLLVFICAWLLLSELLGAAVEEYVLSYFVNETFIGNSS